RSFSKAVT
ncbi:hypothetical protein E2320_002627, partial [Naja naja]